jgi:tetratricopeptide (TPR) repeat protein
MWAALIVIAQVLAAPLPGGQEDFDLCRGMTKGTREESIAACHRVVFKKVLGTKYIAAAYSLLARFADNPTGAITNMDQAIALDPDTPYYYEQRGFQFSLLNDNDRALADFEKGLALKPDDARIFFLDVQEHG